MHRFVPIYLLVFLIGTSTLFAQQKNPKELVAIDTIKIKKSLMNPLAPAKAAFYSAIVPGLGQAYNKHYWKIPLVYAAIGTGIYFYADNNAKYHQFRDAYKRRLEGFTDDEFHNQYSDATLVNAQKTFQRNRDLSVLITVAMYVLNIIDANVDAHLQQFNVNDDLTFKPEIYPNAIDYKPNVGLSLNYRF